ncbi:EamA family transporter [Schaedlerella arabinosiphila]|nr:EamA family transporter [Schaedlerella arabinosiphila]
MFAGTRKYTLIGFLTIIIWGTSAIFTRNLSTNIGAYTSAALVNLIGGIVVLVQQGVKKEGLQEWRSVPRRYWPICGGLFIIYTASSYVSMSMVESDEAVVTLVLIRFLWPLFTLIFTIPILKAKASPWLIGGVSVSMSGIIVAKLGEAVLDLPGFLHNVLSGDDMAGYLMGFVVAVSWGIYTNLTKKYVGMKRVDGVGIYMVITAAVLGAIAFFTDEPRRFTADLTGQILYAGVVVGSLANVMWNLAIKKGNMLLVVLASNFLPIISTVMTSFMLGVGITVPILAGSLLVVIGTLWSKTCFRHFDASGNTD